MTEWKFYFRDKVKDTITGFTGLVTARTEYLNGCIRYAVEAPKLNEKGERQDIWEDEERLELVKKAATSKKSAERPGGNRPAPRSRSNPRGRRLDPRPS